MPRFDNAVSKLVQSFFNETLYKGNCMYCAVGNICNNEGDWSELFASFNNGEQINCIDTGGVVHSDPTLSDRQIERIRERAFNAIESTGYTAYELARVESAFENATELTEDDYKCTDVSNETFLEDQFEGLCAVIDVLCEIDNIGNPQQYKDMLKEKPELQNH